MSGEKRVEIKPPSRTFLGGDRSILEDQGVFFERIQWNDRAFIPTGDGGPGVFARVTAAKPVVELVGRDAAPSGDGGGMASLSANGRPTGETPESIRAVLVEQYGEAGIANLVRGGVLRIVEDMAFVPAHVRVPGAEAVYDPVSGIAYLIANRLTAERAGPVLMHEIGEHHGLETMLGQRGWRAMMGRVRVMARVGGSVTQAAWDGVKANYAKFRDLTDAQLAENEEFIHEVIAKVGETGRETGLWRDLVALVKRFLLNLGFAGHVTETDIAALVRGSLNRVMRGRTPPHGGNGAGGVASLRDENGRSSVSARDRGNIDTATRRIEKFVDAFLAGNVKDGDSQILGPTPVVLQAVGAKPRDVLIDGATVRKIVAGKHRYTMSPDLLKQSIAGLYDPLMVFDDPDARTAAPGKLVLTGLATRTGTPVVISVHLDKKFGRYVINDIASVFGHETPAVKFGRMAGNLEYVKDEKGFASSTTRDLRTILAQVVQEARSLGKTILSEADVVNRFGPMYSLGAPDAIPESMSEFGTADTAERSPTAVMAVRERDRLSAIERGGPAPVLFNDDVILKDPVAVKSKVFPGLVQYTIFAADGSGKVGNASLVMADGKPAALVAIDIDKALQGEGWGGIRLARSTSGRSTSTSRCWARWPTR